MKSENGVSLLSERKQGVFADCFYEISRQQRVDNWRSNVQSRLEAQNKANFSDLALHFWMLGHRGNTKSLKFRQNSTKAKDL